MSLFEAMPRLIADVQDVHNVPDLYDGRLRFLPTRFFGITSLPIGRFAMGTSYACCPCAFADFTGVCRGA